MQRRAALLIQIIRSVSEALSRFPLRHLSVWNISRLLTEKLIQVSISTHQHICSSKFITIACMVSNVRGDTKWTTNHVTSKDCSSSETISCPAAYSASWAATPAAKDVDDDVYNCDDDLVFSMRINKSWYWNAQTVVIASMMIMTTLAIAEMMVIMPEPIAETTEPCVGILLYTVR